MEIVNDMMKKTSNETEKYSATMLGMLVHHNLSKMRFSQVRIWGSFCRSETFSETTHNMSIKPDWEVYTVIEVEHFEIPVHLSSTAGTKDSSFEDCGSPFSLSCVGVHQR